MQNIHPCLWFNDQAEEAVKFYVSIFKNSTTGVTTRYDAESAKVSGQKEGSILTIDFTLEGQRFMALNGGPIFQFTPATSFSVYCPTAKDAEELWKRLVDGGTVLMEFQQYPWSERYGWLNDAFGVSWQIGVGNDAQKIIPSLLFVGGKQGKAEEAMRTYVSLFPYAKIETIMRYEQGEGTEKDAGAVKFGLFSLNNQKFIAMDSAMDHKFGFSQAVSYVINCDTQDEINHFWEKLSAGGEKQPCGWLIDTYGVAWQVVPAIMDKMMADPNPTKTKAVMSAMLKMGKLDMAALQTAYDQAQ